MQDGYTALCDDFGTLHLHRCQEGGAFDRYAAHFDSLWSAAREA
jgi:hypothetical protein